MKRNDFFILGATACYSFLFYQQKAGFNFFLFSIVLSTFLWLRTKNIVQNKGFIVSTIGALLSGISIWLYGSNIAIICNILSLSLMSAFAVHSENSLMINLFHAAYSYITAPIYMMVDLVNKYAKQNNPSESATKPNLFQKILLIAVPISISVIFFLLYRSSNDVFNELTNKINLDFISVSFVCFSVLGFFLMYAFFLQRNIRPLHEYDKQKSNSLLTTYSEESPDWITNAISSQYEILSGIILFVLLNLLLASVNITDLIYVWMKHQLPKDVSYSKFVHNGIGALITSIVFAICIILFYFRGAINFNPKNKSIKYLAYTWMIQNVFMILSTLMRNKMYVEQYSLTEKRIGVFIYLLLAMVGLLFTVYKIARQKNNIFLFRANAWACYIIITACSCLNWSPLITAYNIKKSKSVKHFALDIDYLGNLSYNNLQLLINYYNENHQTNQVLKNKIDEKIVDILLAQYHYDWRSAVESRRQQSNFISRLIESKKWLNLNASSRGLTDIAIFKSLTQLESLNLSYNQIWDFKAFENFTSLRALNLSNNKIHNLDTLPMLPTLESLDLSYNSIDNMSLAKKTPNLKTLNMNQNNLELINGIEKLQAIETLDLSNNSIQNLSELSQLLHLKKLIYQSNQMSQIPYIPQLESVDISRSNGTERYYEKWIDSKNVGNIQELIASNTKIFQSGIFSNMLLQKSLKMLDVSNNELKEINDLKDYTQLQSLNISNNHLLMLDSLAALSNLQYLVAQQTTFQSMNFIHLFPSLTHLDLSNSSCMLSIDSLLNESIQSLILDNCNINYVSKQVEFKNLTSLSMEGCSISDISFIRNSKKLTSLSLTSIDEKNIEAILSLSELRTIKTHQITEAAQQKLNAAKPNLIILNYNQEDSYSIRD